VSEWFRRWFGADYQALYPHRDDAEAVKVAALLAARGMVASGWRVLDLACGAGRHAGALEQCGAQVTGLDLSMVQLRAARVRGLARLIRADMRLLPVRTGVMDAVVNLFTSFGYFDTDEEHAMVLAEIARVLRPGGSFAMDFLNAPQVRATLVPRDERVVAGRRVVQERRISDDGRFVIKLITLDGAPEPFVERVRLLAREDIERMAEGAGLTTHAVLGDYDGGPHHPGSPRLLLLARRS
jgi:SAM-dependent methyltransferase